MSLTASRALKYAMQRYITATLKNFVDFITRPRAQLQERRGRNPEDAGSSPVGSKELFISQSQNIFTS